MKKKKKIELSLKEKQLLIIMVAIFILFFVYQLLFVPFLDKTYRNNEKITDIQSSISKLELLSINKTKYEQEIKEYDEEMESKKALFVQDVNQENIIYFVQELEDYSGAVINVLSFYKKAPVSSIDSATEGLTEDTNQDTSAGFVVEGYNTMVDLTYKCSYEQLKKLVDFVNQYKYYRTIEHITTSYDSETGLLNGSMTVNIYTMPSAPNPLEQPVTGVNDLGVTNVFGTMK